MNNEPRGRMMVRMALQNVQKSKTSATNQPPKEVIATTGALDEETESSSSIDDTSGDEDYVQSTTCSDDEYRSNNETRKRVHKKKNVASRKSNAAKRPTFQQKSSKKENAEGNSAQYNNNENNPGNNNNNFLEDNNEENNVQEENNEQNLIFHNVPEINNEEENEENIERAEYNNDEQHEPENNIEREAGPEQNNDEPNVTAGNLKNPGTAEQNRGRKRKKRNLKEERKSARAKGEAYLTAKGNVQPKRRQRSPCKCKQRCPSKISAEERALLLQEFLKTANRDKQKQYVADLVETSETSRTRKRKNLNEPSRRTQSNKYYLQVAGKRVQVCKVYFRGTFDVSNKYVDHAVNLKRQSIGSVLENDKRGKHEPPHKASAEDINIVTDHIKSFPAYESHYSRRHTDSKYLPSNLNLAIMYDKYKDLCRDKQWPIRSRSFYSNIFYKQFNLRFKPPHNDVCTQCSELKAKIKHTNGEDKATFEKKLEEHQTRADNGYAKKKEDKNKMTNEPTLQVSTLDLQQCLPTPLLVDDDVFYKRLLWTYNLTIHDSGTEESHNFMWPESTGGRGSNQIASCVYRYITEIRTDKTHFTFYSDTCGGQNRNINVACMLTHLVATTPHVQVVDQKFLEPGHTHLEADGDHGQIEKAKKVSTFAIEVPRDWMQLVRSVRVQKRPSFKAYEMKTEHFLEFSSLVKNDLVHRRNDEEKTPVNWLKVKWLRFTKEYGKVLYKHTLDEESPFKKLNLRRVVKGRPSLPGGVPQSYEGPIAINPLKKRDVLTLLDRLDPLNRPFYNGLRTSDAVRLVDPDIRDGIVESETGETP